MADLFELATRRLRLYAPSREEVDELLRGERDVLGARIGAAVSEEWWLGPSLLRLLPKLSETMAREPGDTRWVWLVIEPITARVIGDIGFHGPLRAGETAEIGYSVVPDVRGYGYTPEAASALIDWTFAHTNITQIIAQIDPGNAASLRVATKLGMQPLPPISIDYLCFGLSRKDTA